jgi:uncharacterized protein YydD (DUF2326 family)
MPLHLPKLFRLPLKKALEAVGSGENITEVLQVLKNEGVIESYDTILEIRVHRDKAIAVENFFMIKHYEAIPLKNGKKPTND